MTIATNPVRDAAAAGGEARLSLPSAVGTNISLTGGPHNWIGCTIINGVLQQDCLTNQPWNSIDLVPADGKVYASHSGIAHIYDCPSVGGHRSFVRIDYNDGSNYQVSYEHIHGVDQQVSDGQQIPRGYYLGAIGTDTNCGGSASGAHTHMSLWNFAGAFSFGNSQAVDWNGAQIGAWVLDDGSPTQEQYTGCITPVVGGTRQCPTAQIYNDGTVAGGPTISSVSPLDGPATGNTSVTITGSGFTGSTGVQFGGINSASYAVNSDTQITAVSPSFSAVASDITVTNNGVTTPLSNSDIFTFGPCATPTTLNPNLASPQQVDTTITFTASASTCPKPQYEFWLQPPNQAYAVVQGWGGPTWTWDTSGVATSVGTFNVDVWVREVGSVDQYQDYHAIQYTLTNRQPCTSAVLTPTPTSPQQADRTVTFSATSSSCPKPEYEFYLQPPGQGWTLIQGWGGPTWIWDTSSIVGLGVFNVNVWVREIGSGGGSQANQIVAYTLTPRQACVSPALNPLPASPQQVDSIIAVTASSSTCPKPEYEFYLQPPGQGWSLVRGWGGPTWNWDTSGVASIGTFNIDVWVREIGSGVSYQAVLVAPYTLTSRQACASPSLTPNPVSPQQMDSTIVFTATSTACPKPEYQFYLQPPGQGWLLQQAWGGPTWSWATSGVASAGTFNVNVWVREVGSGGGAQANLIISYTLTNRQACAGAWIFADQAAPIMRGPTVTYVGSATTCPKPEFKFWLQAPGANQPWILVQDWGAAAWLWNTSSVASVGPYIVNVWVREVGSGVDHQDNHLLTYIVT